jgi:proline iminopeptidase
MVGSGVRDGPLTDCGPWTGGDGVAAGLVSVNGTRLFADDRGDVAAPALLFIHGGPGQSCYDFMQVQGDRLAERLRIIGVDQRGTLRSDPLPPEPALSAAVLVADFDALREHLEIASWAVLGHSDGGGYALQYVTSHPDTVQAVIFDCPCWDADLTDRNRLPEVARRLDALGQHDDADRCRELASKPGRLTAADETYLAAQTLGPDYMKLYFHDPAHAADFSQIMENSGFTEEQWERGRSHLSLLREMYQARLFLLPAITRPSLLLHGTDDLVATPQMVDQFSRSVPGGTIRTFDRSGHFAYLEQAEQYCEVVTDFVMQNSG